MARMSQFILTIQPVGVEAHVSKPGRESAAAVAEVRTTRSTTMPYRECILKEKVRWRVDSPAAPHPGHVTASSRLFSPVGSGTGTVIGRSAKKSHVYLLSTDNKASTMENISYAIGQATDCSRRSVGG